jgi:WD40 repeat protein
VKLWSTQHGELLFTIRIKAETIAFSCTTNCLALASGFGEFYLFDMQLHDDPVCIYACCDVIRHHFIEFSPDGETLIMSVEKSNDIISRFRNVKNGTIAMLPIHGNGLRTSVSTSTIGPFRVMRVSPVKATCMFATADETGVSLMRTTDHHTLSQIVALPDTQLACGLQFSPDGSELAVGLHNGDVLIYSVPSGKLRRTLRPLGGKSLVSYMPNGTQLLHATWGGLIRVFTTCDWTDRTNFLFGSELKSLIFHLMCIRDRLESESVLPVLSMTLWLHVFTYVALHVISTTMIQYIW